MLLVCCRHPVAYLDPYTCTPSAHLGVVEAPALKANLLLQVFEPRDERLAQLRVGMVQVGRTPASNTGSSADSSSASQHGTDALDVQH